MHKKGLLLGTSSWSSRDWRGNFYSKDCKDKDFISEYASQLPVVEIDSSFYRIPSTAAVRHWNEATPDGFSFAAKIPRVITHDKVLVDCQKDLRAFFMNMDILEDKLGPLLFQFGYFNKKKFNSVDEFIALLKPFLKSLPKNYRFAVEIRNKAWISEKFLNILRNNNVAYTLIDHIWLPRVDNLMQKFDLVTSDFTYIRWLGDRKGFEEITTTFDRAIIDRTDDLKRWVPVVKNLLDRANDVFGFFNNHYAGHAPSSIELFKELFDVAKK